MRIDFPFLLVVVAIAWSCLSTQCQGDQVVLDVLDAYKRADEYIKSFEYDADCEGRPTLSAPGTIVRWRVSVAAAGSKRLAEIGHYWNGLHWQLDPNRCKTVTVLKQIEEYWINRRIHAKFNQVPEALTLSYQRMQTEFALECSGLWPVACRLPDEVNESAITTLLSDDEWSVAPNREFVGDVQCLHLRSAQHELWLGKHIGYAVVRRVSRMSDTDKLVVLYENSRFRKYEDQVWIPHSMKRTICRTAGGERLVTSSQVPDEGVFSSMACTIGRLALNSVADDVFSIDLLPGTITSVDGGPGEPIGTGGEELLDYGVLISKELRRTPSTIGVGTLGVFTISFLAGAVSFSLFGFVGGGNGGQAK